MIDWANVALSSLWIVGLAVILAALGYDGWLAHRQGASAAVGLALSGEWS
jgi:hypothetical protein